MCWDICEQFRIIAPRRKEGRKRERKRESAHGCLRDVRSDSLFFPFVFFGSLCTEFCWTIDTRRVVFRRFYLRLPIVNVRGRYYGWLGFSFGSESTQPSSSHFLSLSLSFAFVFCYCDEVERRKRRRRCWWWWSAERTTTVVYIFSVKKSFVLTRLRPLIDAEQNKITIFRLRN